MEDEVVGAVEALAHVFVDEYVLLVVLEIVAIDAALAVIACDEPALAVEDEAIGAGLATARLGAGVARRLDERLDRLALLPLIDAVIRNIGKQQILAVRDPNGAFRPFEAVGKLFH